MPYPTRQAVPSTNSSSTDGSGVDTGPLTSTSPKLMLLGVTVTVASGLMAMRDWIHTIGSSASLEMFAGPPGHRYSVIALSTESSLYASETAPQYVQVGAACARSRFRASCMSACCV